MDNVENVDNVPETQNCENEPLVTEELQTPPELGAGGLLSPPELGAGGSPSELLPLTGGGSAACCDGGGSGEASLNYEPKNCQNEPPVTEELQTPPELGAGGLLSPPELGAGGLLSPPLSGAGGSPSEILPLTGEGGAACRDGGGSSGRGSHSVWEIKKALAASHPFPPIGSNLSEAYSSRPPKLPVLPPEELQELEDLLNSGTLSSAERFAILTNDRIPGWTKGEKGYVVHKR
jgi:hypothetical protein